jgi:hypothetical protein
MNFAEPDVDLENQYYNSKALKESDPQVSPLRTFYRFLCSVLSFFARGSEPGAEMNPEHFSFIFLISIKVGILLPVNTLLL